MEFMRIKRDIRKIAELGIGIVAITTLVLAGCGGGGGGSASSSGGGAGGGSSGNTTTGSNSCSASSSTCVPLTVTASLGQFQDGATIKVKDASGNVLDARLVASGVAVLYPQSNATVPTYPLLIEAGVTGDKYFDEKSGNTLSVSSTSTGAIRALVPVVASSVGVTTLTEIAAGSLLTASGVPVAGITPASAVGANVAVAQMFGIANVLTPPTLVNSVAQVNALTNSSADAYSVILAALANTGSNPQTVASNLSSSLNGASPTTTAASVITSLKAALTIMASTAPTGSALSTAAPAVTVPTFLANQTLGSLATSFATIAQTVLASPNADPTTVIGQVQTQASAIVNLVSLGISSLSAATTSQNSAASAVAANAPNVATARTLLSSLHTGFIQQVSGVQADLNNIATPFEEAQNFALFMYQGASLASNGSLTNSKYAKSVTVNGWPCLLMSVDSTTHAGTTVCQWGNNNGNSTTIHQLTISGPNVVYNGGALNLIPQGAYSWSDTIIPSVTLTVNSVSSVGVSGVTASTGTATGNGASITLNGSILPGAGPDSGHSSTSLTNLVVAETFTAATPSANATITYGMTGTIAEMSGSSTLDSITLDTGSNLVQDANGLYPDSATIVLKNTTTQNYQFDGTIVMTNFVKDKYSSTNLSPSWNPINVAYTGSVTGINGNASLGKFMTTTGTGLVLTSNWQQYDPTQPRPSGNYPTRSATFAGNIILGSSTYGLNLTIYNGTLPANYNTVTTALTFADASSNSIAVSESGTISGNSVNVSLGSKNTGSVTFTSKTVTTPLTVGTINGGVVSFMDSSTPLTLN